MSGADRDGSHRHHQTDLFLVDVRNHTHRGTDHVSGVLTKQFESIMDKLFPKADVGQDDGAA